MSKWERAGWFAYGMILAVLAVKQTLAAERVIVFALSVVFTTMAITGRPKH
jgi:hypothetical protein